MQKKQKRLIIMTDIGDTLIDEGTEVRNGQGVVVHAECIPGAKDAYLALHEAGYTILMVADGLTRSFQNTMREQGLNHIFSAWIISEEVGEDKPSSRMFSAAMTAAGLSDADKGRVIMVGNNVKRDVRGANRFGIRSVLMDWSDRRPYDEELPEDRAHYRIHTPGELPGLAERLERELEEGEAPAGLRDPSEPVS